MAELGLDRVTSILGITIVDIMTQSCVSQEIFRLLISSACSHDISGKFQLQYHSIVPSLGVVGSSKDSEIRASNAEQSYIASRG